MTYWPEPEKTKIIPEGHYQFRLNKEPELKKFSFTDKNGVKREGRKLVVYVIGLNETGEYPTVDAFMPWEDRYQHLCAALGVQHGRDIQMTGSFFDGDIKHIADKNDPTKSWPRIINIKEADHAGIPADGPADEDGDDIPF